MDNVPVSTALNECSLQYLITIKKSVDSFLCFVQVCQKDGRLFKELGYPFTKANSPISIELSKFFKKKEVLEKELVIARTDSFVLQREVDIDV